ncbi:hypothetical protein G7054_g12909 [Neopestalotiopsis clavispora]|nr:hypothetical protein G7054_g12909 [Neopestalotiopsis clavispora]
MSSPIANGAVVTFTNLGSGTCIDLAGGNAGNGVAISGWKCHGGNNQKWQLQQVGNTGPWPVYMIKNQYSGTYMDLYNGGTTDGTPIYGWQGGNSNNPHQRWRFVTGDPHNGNVVLIENIGAGTYVDLYLGGGVNGTGINGWSLADDLSSGNPHQQWKVAVTLS